MFKLPARSSIFALVIIFIVIAITQILLPLRLQYFSFFTLDRAGYGESLLVLITLLTLSLFMNYKVRSFFFVLSFFICMKYFTANISGALIAFIGLFVFYLLNLIKSYRTFFNSLIFLMCLAFSFFSIRFLLEAKSISILLLFLVLTWNLKILAWFVTVRVYNQSYKIYEFFDFFFNPVFYFYTNDLNVLTPKRFLESSLEKEIPLKSIVKSFLLGWVLIIAYGIIQEFIFNNKGLLESNYFLIAAGIISVVTAIIFHWANVSIQISLLNALGYDLAIDMNKPWKAVDPIDYWKRMHYYVREYFLEIISRPLFVFFRRRDLVSPLFYSTLILLFYLAFLTTQMGFQPYRIYKGIDTTVIIAALFGALFFIPALFENSFLKQKWKFNRVSLFLILSIGYSFIYYFRKGF